MLRSMLCAAVMSLGLMSAANAVEVGDKAPTFASLPGVDGKSVGLNDLKDKKAVVVIFTCNTCPVAIDYEDRFIKFAKDYESKGVAVVAINVKQSENLEAMKTRADKKGFNFAYVYDAGQASAVAFGAKVTPHIYVLDGDRKVSYIGAFDDSNDPNSVKKEFVKDAVDAALAGKEAPVKSSKPRGCGIGIAKK